MNPKLYYKELGKLLYAIAKADGTIREKETGVLRKIVSRELAPAETAQDPFGTDAAFYTEFEFETLEEFNADPDAAFSSFASYVKMHRNEFSKELRDQCMRLVKKVSEAYKGTNRAEQHWIDKLKTVFDQ